MKIRSFQTVEHLAAYQVGRELAEALRVQSMLPVEHFQWLREHWGRLQDDEQRFSPTVRRVLLRRDTMFPWKKKIALTKRASWSGRCTSA